MSNGEIFVARQPILDRRGRVYAYELLFRSSMENRAGHALGRAATNHVISASYLDIGIEELTSGRPAFLNFNRDLLIDGTAEVLEPSQVVIEVLEDVVPDHAVVESITALKRQGFRIALDDLTGKNPSCGLLPLADILKVDLKEVPRGRVRGLVEMIRLKADPHAVLLAEKVEDHSLFADAKTMGFDLFQGYFFSRPEVLKSSRIPESKVVHLKLLQAIQSDSVTLSEMEDIIKSDVALTTKLLKYINAAAFPWAHRVSSVRHALVLLGETSLRKWMALIALSQLASEKPRELAIMSSCRGKFCELLGQLGSGSGYSELDHFLLGALSPLDAMLDVPMEDALAGLPVSNAVKDALCGERTDLRDLLDLIESYERGDWQGLKDCCQRARLDEGSLPQIYRDALLWSDRVLRD